MEGLEVSKKSVFYLGEVWGLQESPGEERW